MKKAELVMTTSRGRKCQAEGTVIQRPYVGSMSGKSEEQGDQCSWSRVVGRKREWEMNSDNGGNMPQINLIQYLAHSEYSINVWSGFFFLCTGD